MKPAFTASLLHLLLLAAALAVLGLGNGWAALSADDLLEPEKAFRISTRALDRHTVEVRFEIADGYYMYRDRFKFETADGKLLADAELPPGVRKKDAFFGETQTYRREVLIRVPVTARELERGRVKLKVTSQGCSDTGVCYVPLEQIVDVRLPGSASAGRADSSHADSSRIRTWLGQAWVQALLGSSALTIFALSLQFAPPLRRWGARVHGAPWFYPGLGFSFAALALWGVSPLLVQQLKDAAWGAWLVMAAVCLHALDPLPPATGGVRRFAKGVGVLALVAGVMLLVFAAGGRSLLVSSPTSIVSGERQALHFERVSEMSEFEARLRGASRVTMLDFYADWCVTCKEMERFTFSDPAVSARMRKMQLLQVDVTHNTESDKQFLRRFGIFGPPAILFFDTSGNELRALRVIGYQPAKRFGAVLDSALRASAAPAKSGDKQ